MTSNGDLVDSRVTPGVTVVTLAGKLSAAELSTLHAEYQILTEISQPLIRTSYLQQIPILDKVPVSHYEQWNTALQQTYVASLGHGKGDQQIQWLMYFFTTSIKAPKNVYLNQDIKGWNLKSS